MANQILNVKICQRTDTEANWINKNPVLLNGEMAISSDKDGRYKLGNGTSKWSELSYAKARMEKSDVTTALGYTPPTKDTTYEVATTSANGLMSSTDKKRLDSVVGIYGLGSMTGKTITDLRNALKAWLANYCNIANASAYFTGDSSWMTLWNANDTTSTIPAGSMFTVRVAGFFGNGTYAQLEITSYYDKNVYYTALTNNTWRNVQQVAFTDSSITGNAATATALTTSAGSATQPVYFSGGKPVACTYTLGKSVPSDAKFTDTNTWRGIQNNLTSTSTTDSLSAAQGKVLNDKFASYVPTSRTVNGKALSGNISLSASDVGAAASSHTHSYAGSSSVGGVANSATKLATARTINGTSFDGSGNITTANWGATRTIKIGQQSLSINGSQNYTFDLPSIMGRINVSSSGSTNANKWIKFGTIDMSSAAAWRAFSCDIVVEDTENSRVNGVLHIHTRVGATVGILDYVPALYWRSLSSLKYELSVKSVKVSDGKYDLYFKPVDTYCSPLFTVINGYNQQYLTLVNGATYVDSITAASTSTCYSVANIVKDSNNGSSINITFSKSGQSSTSQLASWNGYELGAISSNNVTVGTATNATKLSGYTASTAASGDTIALRTSSGYINATYFNQSSSAEIPTTSSYIVYANSDGYFRKSSLTNIKTILGLGSAAYTTSSAYAAASHNHNASNINAGTLSSDRLPVVPVTKGGTGQTTLVNSANVLINALGTASDTPKDADYYVSQYAGGGTTTTTYHRRPMSSLWAYVKGKADSAYAYKSHGNHVPATETANNAKFLRNDNTWQTVTPANIGAATTSHTHNYAGSSSAGGAANSVKGTLSISVSNGANSSSSSFDGSSDVNITVSGISHTHTEILKKSNNTISSTTNDTTSNWGVQNNSVHFYNTVGLLNGQPSQYGFLVNITNGVNEVHQLWCHAPGNSIYHRGGNSAGWNNSWKTLVDSANYGTVLNNGSIGNLSIPTHLSVGGYNNASYVLSTSSLICSSWIRTTGATGWYSETYGGGWYMSDTTWMRAYAGKSVYTSGTFQCDGGFKTGNTSYNNGWIELYGSTPYIDFHFGSSTADYTSRIIEQSSGVLTVTGGLTVDGRLTASDLYHKDWTGTSRKPVSSAGGETNKVAMLSTSNSTTVALTGRWGSSSSFSAKSMTWSSSDVRLKDNIKPSTVNATEFVNRIQMREFDWNDGGGHQIIGFIADELEELDSRLAVGGGYTEEGYMNVKSVNEFYLLGYVTKAVQELSQENQSLRTENESLRKDIEAIKKALNIA